MGQPHFSRRQVLIAGGTGLLVAPRFAARNLFAEELLLPTPRLTEGPFYPDRLPLDQDNDLILINDRITPAIGIISHVTGRVLTRAGSPVRNATIEIWQCDANAVYLHTRDSGSKQAQQDANFQGYGRFETASDGAYRFRTIKPVPYPGRPAPHIHIKVSLNGQEALTTQLMVRGHEGNLKDGVFRDAGDLVDRELIQGDFQTVAASKIGELSCRFDIILGQTPDERQWRRR